MTGLFRQIVSAAVAAAVALGVGGCATTAPITLDESQRVGVAILGTGAEVSFPSVAGGGASVVAIAVLGAVTGVIAIAAYNPLYIFGVPRMVKQAADRAACVSASYEGHPNLPEEISAIVMRDAPPGMLADVFLADFKVRSNRRALIVEDESSGTGLTHEAAIRRAAAAGIDVLFELTPRVSFDYKGPECAVYPLIRLAFRVTRVNGLQELASGYGFDRGRTGEAETTGTKTISRWLDEPGALAGEIQKRYEDAVTEIWYVRGGPRFVLPWAQ